MFSNLWNVVFGRVQELKIVLLQETNASNLITLDRRNAFCFALLFPMGAHEQIKSQLHLTTTDKNELTDKKILLILDMLMTLSSSIACSFFNFFFFQEGNTMVSSLTVLIACSCLVFPVQAAKKQF